METLDTPCEICGRPGQPSWGDSVLCESCYGTLGATCAGRPRKTSERQPLDIRPLKNSESEGGVC